MLVGRMPVLETLHSLAAEAHAASRVAWLVGAEGVGKSALSGRTADASGLPVLRIDLFPEDRAVQRSTVETLASLLGAELGTDPADSLLRAVEDFGPVCIRIEDAQWLDEESQAILWRIVRRLLALPVLLLLTSLDDTDGGVLLDGLRLLLRLPERGRIIVVEPLGRGAVAELVAARLGTPVTGWTLDRIVSVTGGYPALIVSLVDQLRRAESIADMRTVLRSLSEPSTGSGLLRRHANRVLDEASPPLRAALLTLGAAQLLSIDQIAHVLRERALTPVSTATLADSGLVDVVGIDGLRLRYRVTESVIVGHFSPDEVRATHRVLGELLGGRRGLEHRVAGADRFSSPTLAAELGAEMEDAYRRGDRETTYQMAVLAASLEPERVPDLVFAALWSTQPSRLADHQKAIENLASSPARMVGMSLLGTNDLKVPGAAQLLDHLDLSPHTADRELLLLGYWLLHVAARAGATSLAELAVAARPLVESLKTRGRALVADGELRLGDRFLGDALLVELVLEHLFDGDVPLRDRLQPMEMLRNEAVSEGLTDGIPEADLILNLVRNAAGDVTEAVEALAAVPTTINPTLRLEAGLACAHTRFLAGDWETSLLVAEQASALALDTLMLDHWQRASDLARLVPAVRGEMLRRPDVELSHQDAGGPLGHALRDLVDAWRIVALDGDARELTRLLDGVWATGTVDRTGSFLTGVLRVRAHVASDDLPGARTARSDLAAGSYTPFGRAYALAHADAVIAAAAGEQAEARAAFADAARHLTEHIQNQGVAGPRLYVAVLAEDWGAAVVADELEASEDLRGLIDAAVLMLAVSRGDTWRERLARLRALLAPSASPAGRLGLGRWSLLTTREREVAELVADGLSNRAIASELFITVRTAEYHVHNILSKLGMESRHDLRSGAEPPALSAG